MDYLCIYNQYINSIHLYIFTLHFFSIHLNLFMQWKKIHPSVQLQTMTLIIQKHLFRISLLSTLLDWIGFLLLEQHFKFNSPFTLFWKNFISTSNESLRIYMQLKHFLPDFGYHGVSIVYRIDVGLPPRLYWWRGRG